MRAGKADVIIIGAGAIGCAIAYFLGKEGVKTIVIERDSIGAHASGFAPGLLYPLGGLAVETKEAMLPMMTMGFQMHKELYQELVAETGIDYHFRQSALFRCAFTDMEAQTIKNDIKILRQQGFHVSWLEGDTIRQEENRISPWVIGAACYEGMAEVDSYRYVLSLAQAAEKYGAHVRSGEFLGIKRKDTEYPTIQLSSGDISCDCIVLAMGAWTGLMTSSFNIGMPVKPEKGQTLNIRAPGAPFTSMLAWDNYYCSTTRNDGLIYFGATHEDAGFNEQATLEGKDILMNSLVHMVPILLEAQVVLHTACLRPLTNDRLPIIGEISDWEGVYLATGHWTKGILLSLITARAITDLIVKRDTSIPVDPFSPNRFVYSNPG